MGVDYKEKLYTEKAAPFIEKAGGKIGGLNYLSTTNPSLRKMILPIQVVFPGEEANEVKVDPGNDGRYIIRSSHLHDFQGLVDVLKTYVADNSRDIRGMVQAAKLQARTPRVLGYGRYENPSYDGNVTVGIQPYISGQRGSIVEHPNIPGDYLVSFVDEDFRPNSGGIRTRLYHSASGKFEYISGDWTQIHGNNPDKTAKKVVDAYQTITESNLAKPGYSLQMEFLNDNGSIYVAQVRIFQPKIVANFELEGRRRLVFGITPKEGIVLPVFQSPDGFFRGGDPLSSETPWAWLRTLHQEMPDLRFHPKNLAAYLISQSFYSGVYVGLEHNHFRFAQKADITIFEQDPMERGDHDFTRLIAGEKDLDLTKIRWGDWISGKALLNDTILLMAERALIRENFCGELAAQVKIVSDGKTATVEPVFTK